MLEIKFNSNRKRAQSFDGSANHERLLADKSGSETATYAKGENINSDLKSESARSILSSVSTVRNVKNTAFSIKYENPDALRKYIKLVKI